MGIRSNSRGAGALTTVVLMGALGATARAQTGGGHLSLSYDGGLMHSTSVHVLDTKPETVVADGPRTPSASGSAASGSTWERWPASGATLPSGSSARHRRSLPRRSGRLSSDAGQLARAGHRRARRALLMDTEGANFRATRTHCCPLSAPASRSVTAMVCDRATSGFRPSSGRTWASVRYRHTRTSSTRTNTFTRFRCRLQRRRNDDWPRIERDDQLSLAVPSMERRLHRPFDREREGSEPRSSGDCDHAAGGFAGLGGGA